MYRDSCLLVFEVFAHSPHLLYAVTRQIIHR